MYARAKQCGWITEEAADRLMLRYAHIQVELVHPGPHMMKPCLDCGTPANGTRCPQHKQSDRGRCKPPKTCGGQTRGPLQIRGGPPKGGEGRTRQRNNLLALPHRTNRRRPLASRPPHPRDTNYGGGPLAPAHRSCNIRRRHLTARGWDHARITERLQLLRNGPPTPQGQGHTPDPGRKLYEGTPDDPAPLLLSDVSGVGPLGGGG
jgi:hypothetical protein